MRTARRGCPPARQQTQEHLQGRRLTQFRPQLLLWRPQQLMRLWTGHLRLQLLQPAWLQQPLTSQMQLLGLVLEMIVFLFAHLHVEASQHLFVTLRAVES